MKFRSKKRMFNSEIFFSLAKKAKKRLRDAIANTI